MNENNRMNNAGQSCLQQKINKTTYLVGVHFSKTSKESVEDKLKRVILSECISEKRLKSDE